MDVWFVTPDGVTDHTQEELLDLLDRPDGFTWVDIPDVQEPAADVLGTVFRVHPMAVDQLVRRNHLPSVHGYAGHYLLVLHSPLLGRAGHVHLLELDLVVGLNFLVTAHGPLNPVVDPRESLRETEAILARLRSGRLTAASPTRVAAAISSAVAARQGQLMSSVAEKLPGLEQEVMASRLRQPEQLLEQMFLVRHELITARTMASQTYDILSRVVTLEQYVSHGDERLVRDVCDQFDRLRSVADGEAQFLFGVIELYQTKVDTKMTVAMERLAVIAAVTLPITAIASVYGMNVIVNGATRWGQLVLVLAVMAVMSGLLLAWARRQGWW